MTDTPWTAGPWFVVEASMAPKWWIVQNPDTWINRVAAVPAYAKHVDGSLCNSEANARLIAAAPDLFAALAEFIAIDDDEDATPQDRIDKAWATARAALAKAKGEAA